MTLESCESQMAKEHAIAPGRLWTQCLEVRNKTLAVHEYFGSFRELCLICMKKGLMILSTLSF